MAESQIGLCLLPTTCNANPIVGNDRNKVESPRIDRYFACAPHLRSAALLTGICRLLRAGCRARLVLLPLLVLVLRFVALDLLLLAILRAFWRLRPEVPRCAGAEDGNGRPDGSTSPLTLLPLLAGIAVS